MVLSLGYSPCPNDCFIFDALVHGKVDTGGLVFRQELHDVETLNRKAMEAQLDITKLSFHAFGYVTDQYILLRSGSALGFNCGPLLVSKRDLKDPAAEIRSVAIPGKLTTASFLLSLAYPHIKQKLEMPFDQIEDAVLAGEADAGLIIHENRFTYLARGLKKVADLGEFWESLIHAPIPLGGIVMRRSSDPALLREVNRLIRLSVQYAFAHPESAMPYVKEHAQAMDPEVMKQHIALYVNEFSEDLGDTGINAIELMFSEAAKHQIFKNTELPLIIEEI